MTPPEFLAGQVQGWSFLVVRWGKLLIGYLGRKIRSSVLNMLSLRYFLDIQAEMLSKLVDI